MRADFFGRRTAFLQNGLLAVIAAFSLFFYASAALRAARAPLFQNEYRNMALNIAEHAIMKDVSGPGPSARRLPLYPVFLSVFSRPGDRGAPAFAAQALLGLLSVLLAFAAARRLGGPLAGLAAAAAVAFDPNIYGNYAETGVEALYLFAILVSFNAVLAWGENPSKRSAIFAGLGIGATLLCRSALLFLPPLLAVAAYRLSPRLRKTAGLLALCAYLPLAPWAARNAVLLKGFVPFESFVPATALYGASLGRIEFPDPWEAVSDAGKKTGLDVYAMSDLDKTKLLDKMALANIARSPWLYARSSARRFIGYWNYRLIFFLPMLLWLFRLKPGERAEPALAVLFAAYFSVHALIILDAAQGERYLFPALPVLYCAAAAALAWLAGLGANGDPGRRSAARWVLPVCSAALAFLVVETYCFMTMEVWRYGVRGAPAPAETAQLRDLEEEIRLFPRESKLYNDAGVLLLLAGRAGEAAQRLQKAVELDPLSKESSDNLAEARRAGRR